MPKCLFGLYRSCYLASPIFQSTFWTFHRIPEAESLRITPISLADIVGHFILLTPLSSVDIVGFHHCDRTFHPRWVCWSFTDSFHWETVEGRILWLWPDTPLVLAGIVGRRSLPINRELPLWASPGRSESRPLSSRASLVRHYFHLIANPRLWASPGRSDSSPLSSRTSLVRHYPLLIARPSPSLLPGSCEHSPPPSPTQLDPRPSSADCLLACPSPPAEPWVATQSATEIGSSPSLEPPPASASRPPGTRPRPRDRSSPPTAPLPTFGSQPSRIAKTIRLRHAGPCSANYPRPRSAAPLALVLGLGLLRRPPPPSPLLPSPRTGLGSRRAKLGHAPPTTPVLAQPHRWRSSSGWAYRVDHRRCHHCCRPLGVSPSQAGPCSADYPRPRLLAPPHRWRSSSGRAYCVDHCRRHHRCRPPARGWGLADPSRAMLRRLPPPSPRRTAGAHPRAGLIASTTVAVTTVAVSPHGVGVSPIQAGPCSCDYPRPRPAAPLALVLGPGLSHRLLPPSPLLPSPCTGLGSRRAKLGHAQLTSPVLAPPHRWRSSSGWAS